MPESWKYSTAEVQELDEKHDRPQRYNTAVQVRTLRKSKECKGNKEAPGPNTREAWKG